MSYGENEKIQDVPIHLTKIGAKQYKYPHDYENNFVKQKYMNEKIRFYKYNENKFEIVANERLEKLWGKD